LVVGNKNFTEVTKPSEIVQLLLNDDQLANLNTSGDLSAKQAGKRPAGPDDGNGNGKPMRDLWDEEGDDFFGHSGAAGTAELVEDDKDAGTPVPSVSVGKKRKGPTGAPRGRRPGSKNKPKGPKPNLASELL
jgi:chromatin-remodeling ATPase INO80